MPGTPATYASFCDPASPAVSASGAGQQAKMDMELSGTAGSSSNDSDEMGQSVRTKTNYMHRS